MNNYIHKIRRTKGNNLSKLRGLPHKHKTSPHNDEQSGEDYKYSGDNKCMPQYQYPTGKPYIPEHHEINPPSFLPIPVPKPLEPRTNHAYFEASTRSTSSSSSLSEPCSEDDISDPSSSCSSSSSDSPSVEMDSREGMDREEGEHPDLDGGGGMGRVIDSPVGEELRGEGALPIQHVQGWEWKKERWKGCQ